MVGGRSLLSVFLAVIFFAQVWLVSSPVRAGASLSTEEQIDEIQDFEELDLEELLDTDVYSSLGSFAGVVVSASKHEQDIGESPSAITVISREQIENTHCTDLVCLLRQVPEVQVVRIKPMFPAVGARALVDESNDKTLLLVDGQEVNVEFFGIVLWNAIPVHLDDIERIEVIRGPGSAMYGANAHSMVVSIFTRKISDSDPRVFMAMGEHDRLSMNLRAGQRFGDLQLHLSGGLETAGHWVTQGLREREVGRVRLSVQHETDSAVTVARAGLVYGEGDIYTILGASKMKDALMASAFLAHVRDNLQAKLSFSLMDAAMSLGGSEITYQSFYLGRVPDDVPFINTALDLEVQLDWSPFSGNFLIAGSNYRWDYLDSYTIEPETVHQHRLGVFLHDEQKLGESFSLVGSLRFDYNSITPATLSPRLAVVYKPVADQFIRLAFGQAFRKPAYINTSIHLKGVETQPGFEPLEDIFLEGVGNSEVGNESITSIEVGYYGRFLENQLVLEADMFYQRYRSTITLQSDIVMGPLMLPDLSASSIRFENAGREVDSLGGSVSVAFRLRRTLRIGLNYTLRHSYFASEASGINVVGEGGQGDRVSWEPAHLVNLNFHYLPDEGLRLGAAVYGASAYDGWASSGAAFDPRVLVPQPATWFLSGFVAWRVSYQVHWVEAGVRALNALAMPFSDFPGEGTLDGWAGGEPVTRRVVFFLRGVL